MKNLYLICSIGVLIIIVLFGCTKGSISPQETFMRTTISYYHSDSSVYTKASINNISLLDRSSYSFDDQVNSFDLVSNRIDSGVLDINILKTKSGNNLTIRRNVRFTDNINRFILLQTCPNQAGELLLPYDTVTVPAPSDSVKVRFFFSNNDFITNPNAGFTNRRLTRMRLQIFTFTSNPNPNLPPLASTFSLVINNVDFNSCGYSPYITLARNKKYGFRVRDISSGVPTASSLVQNLSIDDVAQVFDANGNTEWDFKKGAISTAEFKDIKKKFLTFRVRRNRIQFENSAGNITSESSLNGQFIVGLNNK